MPYLGSVFAEKKAAKKVNPLTPAPHSEEKAVSRSLPASGMSRSDCRTVARLVDVRYTVLDGGPTGSTSSTTDQWETYGYSVDVAKAPVQVYDAQTAPYGRIPADVAAAENSDYLAEQKRRDDALFHQLMRDCGKVAGVSHVEEISDLPRRSMIVYIPGCDMGIWKTVERVCARFLEQHEDFKMDWGVADSNPDAPVDTRTDAQRWYAQIKERRAARERRPKG